MRPHREIDTARAITEFAVGEALVSLLDGKGRPGMVQRAYVIPPGSRIGPVTPEERRALVSGSLVAGVYDETVDRESAYEALKARAVASADTAQEMTQPGQPGAQGGGLWGQLSDVLFGSTGPRGGRREGLAEAAAKSAVRTIGSTVGREIVRGVLGGILGGGRRR